METLGISKTHTSMLAGLNKKPGKQHNHHRRTNIPRQQQKYPKDDAQTFNTPCQKHSNSW